MSETKELTKMNGQAKPEVVKLPSLADLMTEDEQSIKENALMVLLNQEPPKQWLLTHPMSKGLYLPIARVEYLLSRIFTKWWVEIRDTKVMANSTVVTVRLYVKSPIDGEVMWNDGVGASPIQTDKDAGASDWNKVKSDGVMKSIPAAESYAVKDAAEKYGKLFGKDLNRKDDIQYSDLLKPTIISLADLRELFELKKDVLSDSEIKDAERILNDNETKSFNKLHKHLMTV